MVPRMVGFSGILFLAGSVVDLEALRDPDVREVVQHSLPASRGVRLDRYMVRAPLKVTFGNPAGIARTRNACLSPVGFASPAFAGFALVASLPPSVGAISPINCACVFSTREPDTGYVSTHVVTRVTRCQR